MITILLGVVVAFVLFVLGQEFRERGKATQQLIALQGRQIEELRNENTALRQAVFPKAKAEAPKPAAPDTPAVNMRQPWRQLKKILEAQHNTKQRQHDNLVAGIQKAQERPNA